MLRNKRLSLVVGGLLTIALAFVAGIWLNNLYAGSSPGEKEREVRRETERERNRESGERRETERERDRESGERRERESQERREAGERTEQGEREMHQRREHLELERGELELRLQQTEAVIRIAEICKDDVRSAAYAVSHITDFCEPKAAIEKLEFLAEKTTNDAIRRVIRIRLAELYAHTERPQESLKQLERLVTGR